MSPTQTKKISAIKVADTLNMIEGALVSNFAKEISAKLAKGEITGEKELDSAETELSRANMM